MSDRYGTLFVELALRNAVEALRRMDGSLGVVQANTAVIRPSLGSDTGVLIGGTEMRKDGTVVGY